MSAFRVTKLLRPRTGALRSLAFAALCVALSSNARAASDYAVVVSTKTAENTAWRQVADTLVKRHQAQLVLFTNTVDESLPPLQKQFPRYVCFVAQPEEVTKEFVAKIHRLTRRFDDDPYTDCFWGILTGYDAANAMAIAKQEQPLTIHKVASGTELAMDMVEEGVWYCELNKNKSVRKARGGSADTVKCPDDTTECLVKALNDEQPDMFVTSGHATARDWMIGFRYKNGFFKHQDGRLFGEDTQKHKLAINSPNPKVYLPIGNCLMGHIDKPDCMATSWMNSAGVCQMLGYTEVTWYGYAGWGVLDYFVEQPGRYTFSEAFFANQHALIHRLATCFPEAISESAKTAGKLTDAGRAAGLTANDGRGLLYDRDIVAFYGDPAWSARMADLPKAFEQGLTENKGTFTFEIKPNRGAGSFKPVNTNGAQRRGRPFVAYLPRRVRDVKVASGAELNPVIADDFILVPNPGVCDPEKTYKVVFTARPML